MEHPLLTVLLAFVFYGLRNLKLLFDPFFVYGEFSLYYGCELHCSIAQHWLLKGGEKQLVKALRLCN